MDGRLEARLREMVAGLAREHQQELAAAGTLVDLETLTCQIGDEVTRLLTERELARRGQEQPYPPENCPDCGRQCLPDREPEPTVLVGLRGKLAFSQAKYFCHRCRRSFFPSGGAMGNVAAQQRDDEGAAKSDLGWSQQRQLRAGVRGVGGTE